MNQRVLFLYRDADNYKFALTRIVSADTPLKPGDEIEYERLGFDRDTFHDEVVGYLYDDTSDHNLLEVIDVENTTAEADLILARQPVTPA
jgi:hypothetical protein